MHFNILILMVKYSYQTYEQVLYYVDGYKQQNPEGNDSYLRRWVDSKCITKYYGARLIQLAQK